MKAFVNTEYVPPESLELREVPRPTPGENEVLVRVRATAVNDYDWCMVRGEPRSYRLLFGLFRPKHPVPGMELSGVVEACGPGAQTFQVGDAVYGDISAYGFGTFAEYVAVHEGALRRKPDGMSFEEAASLSHASMLAMQALVDAGKIQNAGKILINGGGGGVGFFGLQIARQYGAEVTGVDTGDKLATMRELGFDHVIDYRQTDFTRSGERYDLILDCKTTRSPFATARALNPGGTYATVGGSTPRILQTLCLGPLIAAFTKKRLRMVALKPNKDLPAVEELFAAGKLKCVIDGPHPFADLPRLLRHFGEGRHTGKVIVSLPG